jgi:hypothetical protein
MVSNMVTAILNLILLQLAFIDLDRLSVLGLLYVWRQSSDPANVDFAETPENFIPFCGQLPKADPAHGNCDQNVDVTWTA